MTPKETIKYMTIRANALAAMDAPNEETYWQLKKELFNAERVWEQETPRYNWPEAMKSDLYKLSLIFQETWQKITDYKHN